VTTNEGVGHARWLIPSDPEPTDPGPHDSSRDYWVSEHADNDYTNVFSVGEDSSVRRLVIEAMLRTQPCNRILLAGCGSRTALQEDLIRQSSSLTRVVATDFRRVIEIAESRFRHDRLTYVALEDGLRPDGKFDVVIAVNVAVQERDADNRRLIAEWARQLRVQGSLIMLVPIFCAGYELADLTGRADLMECLDVKRSRWREREQGTTQTEYLPLRLRRILKEAGLVLDDLRIVFLEDERSIEQSLGQYGLDDEDLLVYEQMVVARRAGSLSQGGQDQAGGRLSHDSLQNES
jgi:SAM-dependent methyltransferase